MKPLKWYEIVGIVLLGAVLLIVGCVFLLLYFLYDTFCAWRDNRRHTRQEAVLVILREAWPGGLFGLEIFQRSEEHHKQDKTFPPIPRGSYELLSRMEDEGWIRSEIADHRYEVPRLKYYLSGRRPPVRRTLFEWSAVLEQQLPDQA